MCGELRTGGWEGRGGEGEGQGGTKGEGEVRKGIAPACMCGEARIERGRDGGRGERQRGSWERMREKGGRAGR